METTCRPISLSDGCIAWVDTSDYDDVAQYKWQHGVPYATRTFINEHGRKDAVTMHKHLLGINGMDHRNTDPLDNRRCNLRVATQSQNSANRRKSTKRQTYSKYKGVTWDKRYRVWIAQIGVEYKHIHLGTFSSEEDAAKAYDEAAIKYFGEFARPNEDLPINEEIRVYYDHARQPAIRRIGCLIEECSKKHHAAGYCNTHYASIRRDHK